ncbi:MAG TPA: MarR family transcriptional regulator [Polyangiales bacterium]|nr:MarR family transcriptional regulator [Polyangiales bacterium]
MSAAVDYHALAELRYRIRVFVSFSERAAREHGVEPKQHQALLAIKGLPPELRPTLRVIAERLQLRHHSAVELLDRLEAAGLATRVQNPDDRREVLVRLSARGEQLLRSLSVVHQEELQAVGPDLLRALSALIEPRKSKYEGRRATR